MLDNKLNINLNLNLILIFLIIFIFKQNLFAMEYSEKLDRLTPIEKERVLMWSFDKKHPELCSPTKEFKEALSFMRLNKSDINPSEGRARLMAAEIAKGCDGAASRFAKVYLVLVKSGVDIGKSVETALKFSKEDDETTENFFQIFKKTYLSEFFDFDYSSAIQLSYEISTQYKGNRKKSREDFLNLLKYCTDKNEISLPMKTCAELTLKLARLSQYYPDGIFKSFVELYKTLRTDKRFGVSVSVAISILMDVLPYGPTAPKNFIESYDYAMSTEGLGVEGKEALQFALAMAHRSSKKLPPPIYIPPKEIILQNGAEPPKDSALNASYELSKKDEVKGDSSR